MDYEDLPKEWKEECSDCKDHNCDDCDFYTDRYVETIGTVTSKEIAEHIIDKESQADSVSRFGYFKNAEIQAGDYTVYAWYWTSSDMDDEKNLEMKIIAYK